jgi:hypothetical protein
MNENLTKNSLLLSQYKKSLIVLTRTIIVLTPPAIQIFLCDCEGAFSLAIDNQDYCPAVRQCGIDFLPEVAGATHH